MDSVAMNCFNLSYKDFPVICRICLNKGELSKCEKSDLLNLFQNITNIKIEPDDNLPKNVCNICIHQLQNISTFINLSKNNDITLKRILNASVKQPRSEESILESDAADDPGEHLDYSNDVKHEVIVDVKHEDFKSDLKSVDNIKEERSPNSDECKKSSKKSVRRSTKGQPLECEICGESFSTKSKLTEKFRLKLHMRSHIKKTPFECKICFKKFRHSPNLKRHDNIVHKGLRPFKCDVCGKEFATCQRMTEHLRIHTGERPHICSYCGIGFTTFSTRYTHEMRHKVKNGEIPESEKPKKYPRKKPDDPSELECKICKKNFSSKRALYVHTQIHIGKKSFLCAICGKSFLRKSYLEVHVRIHTGEKPYQCNDCGKHFRQPASYRTHRLIHKGERSHKCDVCQRTFINLMYLQRHLKTHTGEKPYKCTFCGKGFALNSNLKVHTRIHTGERPYLCVICYMGFYDSTSLKKHKKSHGSLAEETENK